MLSTPIVYFTQIIQCFIYNTSFNVNFSAVSALGAAFGYVFVVLIFQRPDFNFVYFGLENVVASDEFFVEMLAAIAEPYQSYGPILVLFDEKTF